MDSPAVLLNKIQEDIGDINYALGAYNALTRKDKLVSIAAHIETTSFHMMDTLREFNDTFRQIHQLKMQD